MTVGRREAEIREFYDRWKASVFRFCVLFLGDEERASEATGKAFLRYMREAPDAASDQLPRGLVGFALEAAREWCASPADLARSDGSSLREAILRLPCEQRAVFLLRNVLGMDRQAVSEVTGLTTRRISELWLKSMLALREQLPRDFFKEQKQ